MSRPIDAYALIEKARFEARGMEEPFRSSFAVTVAWLVEKMPTIEPERKVGKWIDYSDDGYVECPFCGSATNCDDNINELHYCFSCGAKMEG